MLARAIWELKRRQREEVEKASLFFISSSSPPLRRRADELEPGGFSWMENPGPGHREVPSARARTRAKQRGNPKGAAAGRVFSPRFLCRVTKKSGRGTGGRGKRQGCLKPRCHYRVIVQRIYRRPSAPRRVRWCPHKAPAR